MTEWTPVSKIVISRKLKVEAICTCNGKQYREPVSIVMYDGGTGQCPLDLIHGKTTEEKIENYRKQYGYQWILKIENTPGSWYLTTLLESKRTDQDTIAIDGGQNWDCVNLKELLKEALTLI